ncbi:PAS domain-containing sensor histidine kinase [Numidum massiliense]|uniref:PAS domain-containing sensor histidine kinase n=1 Tax=Numidum massiliense TaxID=1522315 RepID=UPI0006D5A79B|nr:PAS domain-containing sensor histidine kinase [Numidum massiliense]
MKLTQKLTQKLASLSKIRNKVLLFGLLMSTVPLILISGYYLLRINSDLEENITARQTLKVENIAYQLTMELNEMSNRMTFLSTARHIDEQRALFYDVLRQSESIEEIVLLDAKGRVARKVSRFSLNEAGSGEQWLEQQMMRKIKQRERVHGPIELNDFGQPVMKWAVPVHSTDGHRLMGSIGVKLQLQKLVGEISSQHVQKGERIYLRDEQGRVISDTSGPSNLQHVAQAVQTGDNGEKMLGVHTTLDDFNWELVMEQPTREAFSPIYEMVKRSVLAVLLVILTVSLISVYAGLYFTRPIVTLQQAMRRVKAGEWPKRVEVNRSDEFGELAHSFNEMSVELKNKSERLLQEKERLDIIVGGIGAGLAIVRDDYRVTWMNPLLQSWLQSDTDVPCYALFNDRAAPCADCPGFGASDVCDIDRTMTKMQPNGEKRIFRHRVYPLKHPSDGEKEALIVIEDITEQRQMEENLLQTDKLSALGLMASNFAHEVNNPLATIKVYAEDLADRLVEEGDTLFRSGELDDYLRVIKDNTDRCKDITTNLLNFSRKAEWRESEVDVNQVVRDSIAMVHYVLARYKVTLYTELAPDVPFVAGDSLKLTQVIVNVLNNALDAMEEGGGTLTVATSFAAGEIAIRVADTGIGIPKEHLPKLYDPFYTTKPVGKGTGLGLSVCYGVIQQFRGTILIDSEFGEGTTVDIRIPA